MSNSSTSNSIIRRKGNEWRTFETFENETSLGIKSKIGVVLSLSEAKAEAFSYWHARLSNSYVRKQLGKQYGCVFLTAKGAARFVLRTFGELHGLDVYKVQGNEVFLAIGEANVHNDVDEWFPEFNVPETTAFPEYDVSFDD